MWNCEQVLWAADPSLQHQLSPASSTGPNLTQRWPVSPCHLSLGPSDASMQPHPGSDVGSEDRSQVFILHVDHFTN